MTAKIDIVLIAITCICGFATIFNIVRICVFKHRRKKAQGKNQYETNVNIAITNLLYSIAPLVVMIIFKWILWGRV